MNVVYKYKASTIKGEKVEGKFTAASKEEVLQMLHEKQYFPINVEAEKVMSKDLGEITIFKPRVKIKDLAIFCKQIYTMLNAGIPLIKSLDVLAEQSENKTLQLVLKDISNDIQKGINLTESMKKHRDIFPSILISMVEAGELTGSLESVFDKMSEHFEKESKINEKIKGAMMYPAVLGVVAISVVIFLLIYVIPIFVELFTSSGVALPLPTRILLGINAALTNYWYIFIISIGAAIYSFIKIGKTDQGKLAYDKLKLKLPIVKVSVVKIITARFARTLSTLLATGIPLISALQAAARVTNNQVVITGIDGVVEDIRKGIDLASLLKNLQLFPPMLISMVNVGEESGSLDEMLLKTADFYDDELEASIAKLITLIEPIMIVIMAFVVGLIVLAMMLPMFDMLKII